jgi:hypothetical protein
MQAGATKFDWSEYPCLLSRAENPDLLDLMKVHLRTRGPMTIRVPALSDNFFSYKSGIMTYDDCAQTDYELEQYMVVVGYYPETVISPDGPEPEPEVDPVQPDPEDLDPYVPPPPSPDPTDGDV